MPDEKKVISTEFMDVILKELVKSPDSQIDAGWKRRIAEFNAVAHTPQEKWDFIVHISHLNCGEVSSFVRVLCALETYYLPPDANPVQ